MRLGFIGFGEVAYELSRGFKSEGIEGIVAYDPMKNDSRYGPLVKDRADAAAVTLLVAPGDVVRQADVIIAAVPGSHALQAAEAILADLNEAKLYADVSTSSPTTKRKIAALIAETGAGFVDGALMGGLTQLQHKVPTLVSGSGAENFISKMECCHMNLEKVSDKAGDAIAVKLVRSVYMKGVATLEVEMLEAAHKLQVEELVLDSIAHSVDAKPFKDMMNFLVTASAIHAERQTHEMADCMTMLRDLEIAPTMTEATMKRLQWLADKKMKEKFGGKVPARWQEVVAAWS